MNESIKDKIIDYLIRNRVSTTDVADALGKKGNLPGIMPINIGHYQAGVIKWAYAYGESNWPLHEQITDIEEGMILMTEVFDCGDRAIFGELVSKYILLYRQCKALVVCGNMRDAAALIKNSYPVWCKGLNPVGCFNSKPDYEMNVDLINEHREKYDGAIAVCDDCGVVIIPKTHINEEFLYAVQAIENQEDIWFDRLDHYKENTFEIVCQKKYRDDEVYMNSRKKL